MSDTPKGVTAIVMMPAGDVIASASDFDSSGYGDFSLSEGQAIRARRAAIRAAVRNIAGPVFAQWLRDYTMDCIWNDAREKGRARVVLVPVGWDGDDAEIIRRRSDAR